MPIIHVNLVEGRPKEKVAEVIRNITTTVSETLDAPSNQSECLSLRFLARIGEQLERRWLKKDH